MIMLQQWEATEVYFVFVRHVLPTLHGPHQVKRRVRKRLLERVCHLQLHLHLMTHM